MEKEGLFVSILDLLRRLPRRMLMVLKLNDLTRSLDASLHTTHGQTRPFLIAARICALTAYRNDLKHLNEQPTSLSLWGEYISAWWRYTSVYRGLALMEIWSDISAKARTAVSYTKALVKGNPQNAMRAAAGLDAKREQQEREDLDREKARRALENDDK